MFERTIRKNLIDLITKCFPCIVGNNFYFCELLLTNLVLALSIF